MLWNMEPYITPSAPVVQVPLPLQSTQTMLQANYPNPFKRLTQIAYSLAAPGLVRLEIYNVLGQPVHTLVDRVQGAGVYQVPWDGRDRQGAAVAVGVYVMRLRHPSGVQTRRLLYLKEPR